MDTITLKEAAALIGVTEQTIRNYVEWGVLRAVGRNGDKRFRRPDVEHVKKHRPKRGRPRIFAP